MDIIETNAVCVTGTKYRLITNNVLPAINSRIYTVTTESSWRTVARLGTEYGHCDMSFTVERKVILRSLYTRHTVLTAGETVCCHR